MFDTPLDIRLRSGICGDKNIKQGPNSDDALVANNARTIFANYSTFAARKCRIGGQLYNHRSPVSLAPEPICTRDQPQKGSQSCTFALMLGCECSTALQGAKKGTVIQAPPATLGAVRLKQNLSNSDVDKSLHVRLQAVSGEKFCLFSRQGGSRYVCREFSAVNSVQL